MRPLDVHEYNLGIAVLLKSPRFSSVRAARLRLGPDSDRPCHPGRVRRFSSGFGLAPVRGSISPAPFIADTRRDTASQEYLLCCLACVSARPARTEIAPLAQLDTHPLLAAPHLLRFSIHAAVTFYFVLFCAVFIVVDAPVQRKRIPLPDR